MKSRPLPPLRRVSFHFWTLAMVLMEVGKGAAMLLLSGWILVFIVGLLAAIAD